MVIDKLALAQDQFIIEWGRMSSSWGINRTMAQIHALLLATGKPHSMDQIIERLSISRGNASMNLRELMDWGIVRRIRRPGDRKDTYSCDADPWAIFGKVVRERKRRELDPTAAAIQDCLELLPSESENPETEVFRTKMTQLLELFSVIDAIFNEVFRTDDSLRQAFAPYLGRAER